MTTSPGIIYVVTASAAALTPLPSDGYSPLTSPSSKVELVNQPNAASAANKIITFGDVKRLQTDLDDLKMATGQNIGALSAQVDRLHLTVAALQLRPLLGSEDSFDRTVELSAKFAALHENSLAALDQIELGDLLNDAADAEHFPSNAITISRQLMGVDDVMIRTGSVRIMILGGDAKDRKLAKTAIKNENNAFAKKMMQSALEANMQ